MPHAEPFPPPASLSNTTESPVQHIPCTMGTMSGEGIAGTSAHLPLHSLVHLPIKMM